MRAHEFLNEDKVNEEILDELAQNPTAYTKFLSSPEAEGMLIGIEFEMIVPNTVVDDDMDMESDYSMDARANDIYDIVEFFKNGEYSYMSSRDAERLTEKLWDKFSDWQYMQIRDNLDISELNTRVRDKLREDISENDMRNNAHDHWVANNPNGDPNSDEAQSAIDELTSDFIEHAIDDIMDEQGSEWSRAYDIVEEEMTDEMRMDGDYDESAWLYDIGVHQMSDAENEWGLDWPHRTGSSDSGQSVDIVADDFTDGTGFLAHGYSGYHSGNRSVQQHDKSWIIEPDSSISTDGFNEAGLEFISPAMPLRDGMAMIEKVKKWASSYGCYTNDSTGLHMNISVPGMSKDSLDYVKLALFIGDEHILKQFGREYNTYCRSGLASVKDKIASNPEDIPEILDKMKKNLNLEASKLIHSGNTGKYTSINTKEEYVEFRGPGGDYLDQDIATLTNTALRLAQGLKIATDPEAYKQEYAKKLYKLVGKEGDWTDPNNSVALFSRYALGEINKDELVASVRGAQTARREEKGPSQQYWVMKKDGSGGKQLVHAQSETEAVIIGGKQQGMKRDESLLKLKAEPFKESIENSPRWKSFTKLVQETELDKLTNMRNDIIDGTFNAEFPTQDERYMAIKIIDVELRKRQDDASSNNLSNTEPSAGDAENAVRDSLPLPHQAWLNDIADKTDMDLINVLRNVDTTSILNTQQAAYFRVTIKHELRRRGINDSERDASPGADRATPQTTAPAQTNESINELRRLAGLK